MRLIDIRQITDMQTWHIRREVFQPNRALKKNKLQGDAEATHFGGFLEDKLVGVVTWSINSASIGKIQKLATSNSVEFYQAFGFSVVDSQVKRGSRNFILMRVEIDAQHFGG